MAATTAVRGIPIIEPLLNFIIGSRNERFVKKYLARAAAINQLEPQIRVLTDEQLRGKFQEFRARIEKGEKAGDLLVEAFAVAREAMDRAVGLRNIFNPKFADRFDASQLPGPARTMYEDVKARIAATPPASPAGEWLGNTEPIPAWMQVDIPPELYEAVRGVYPHSKPPFRARPFDVQLIGGMVLYQGKISEMKTGEGKTIVGPLACYLGCIEGLKVHVVTVNDYLVQRDRDWTFPYFRALGLTVGAIHPMHMQPEQVKREMYRCDVVYGTTAEFGFDYLRDNMKRSVEQQVQRRREFAIVDEVDSILIDEARTPLIISGPAHEDAPRYELADRLALHLVSKQRPWQEADDAVQAAQKLAKGLEGDIRNARDKSKVPELQARLKEAKVSIPALERDRDKHTQYYEVQPERKQAHLTHDGIAEAQRVAGVGSIYVGENMDLPHLLEQAVRAHVVYQRDRDYIIMPAEDPMTGRTVESVVIVDVNTGRPMVGRQWSDGLHQAVEAKEKVPVKQETQTVATITIQNFFKMYKRLAGMTGTADTEAQEFHDIYRLDVVSIPTNVPVVRRDFDDLMFLVGRDKWDTIVDEIKTFHDVGRPVLVGTTSVERSETLSKMLSAKHQVRHEVLNAKQHEREANIVESAGQLGAVMIATNMAGRGTDIKLGPISREALLDHWLRRSLASRELTVAATTEQLRENVFRKVAPKELDLPRHEVEKIPFQDLELRLLRHWAVGHTWVPEKKIQSMTAEALRQSLDEHGRFILHRIDWFDSIEQMGGLHVIGTERHESRRIDNQLRGRSGRQGDNGSSRFFVSLDDDLMKMFAGERTMKILSTLGMKEGDAIEHPMLSKSVERAQRKVEERNFQVRKNILEYDEVMEHQRQSFYGLRQRVLEGRDVRGLIFNYIRDSVRDAVGEYLGKDFAAQTASEYVRNTLDVSIAPERLRGLDAQEMDKRIRGDAKEEVRQMVSVTLGEYIPAEGSEVEVDFDAEGLASWARAHFGVEFNPGDLRERGHGGRRAVEQTLTDAAEARIDSADLSQLAEFAEKDYGARQLAKWAETKYEIKVEPAAILQAALDGVAKVEELIVGQAEERYRKREIEYPVDFALSMTMSAPPQNRMPALQQLVGWANSRFGLGWTVEGLPTVAPTPQLAREKLLEASRKFYQDGVLQKRTEEALAIQDPEALETWFRETIKVNPPDRISQLSGEERDNAVRARVETALRAEMLYLERTVLLETLDDLWKNHLYTMDQLRDSIGFRAFSQKDPRIEYKREGSNLFSQMSESVRDRITDMIFKVGMAPQAPMPQAMQTPRQVAPAAPAQAPLPGATPNGGPRPSSSADLYYTPPTRPAAPKPPAPAAFAPAPGLGVTAAAPMSDRAQRDLDAAQRAGTGEPGAKAAPAKAPERIGRNDPCPQGSGRKYKKCCNRADGTCNGQGLTSPSPSEDGDGEEV